MKIKTIVGPLRPDGWRAITHKPAGQGASAPGHNNGPLMSVGDSYADLVVWKWDRARSRWTAILRDDTEIRVQFFKVGGRGSAGRGRSYWTYSIDFADGRHYRSTTPYQNASLAEQAAVDEYLRRKGKQ